MTLLASVESIDKEAHQLNLDDGSTLHYDTLVLATGARHAYFGHDAWEPFAPGLKTLEDATTIRGHILLAFEEAELEEDERKRAALVTFAIVGGGPTGVELAGTIAELARATLPADFRRIDTREARIVLIEASPRVLPAFAEDLSTYAKRSLERLGVEVALGLPVSECTAEGVVFGGKPLAAATIIWAAGVQASPAAQWLDAPADRAGRLKVEPNLTVPRHPEIFAIGDAAIVYRPDGRPVPGIAPAAEQEGAYVANVIRARLRGALAPPPFRYRHAGDLATIGKRRAVIDFGWIKLKGALAWWLGLRPHLLFDRRPQPAKRRAQLAVDLCARPTQRAVDYVAERRAWLNGVKRTPNGAQTPPRNTLCAVRPNIPSLAPGDRGLPAPDRRLTWNESGGIVTSTVFTAYYLLLSTKWIERTQWVNELTKGGVRAFTGEM